MEFSILAREGYPRIERDSGLLLILAILYLRVMSDNPCLHSLICNFSALHSPAKINILVNIESIHYAFRLSNFEFVRNTDMYRL